MRVVTAKAAATPKVVKVDASRYMNRFPMGYNIKRRTRGLSLPNCFFFFLEFGFFVLCIVSSSIMFQSSFLSIKASMSSMEN